MYPAKTNQPTKRPIPAEYKTLSTRLEQHRRDLNQLRLKLNAYATKSGKEVNTYEQIASLKNSVEVLSFDNLAILASLKEQVKSRGDYLEDVARQFSEFHKLRRGVNEYIGGVESSRRSKIKATIDSVQLFGNFQNESSRLWTKFSTSMNAFFF